LRASLSSDALAFAGASGKPISEEDPSKLDTLAACKVTRSRPRFIAISRKVRYVSDDTAFKGPGRVVSKPPDALGRDGSGT
jgi:hypothetical protein